MIIHPLKPDSIQSTAVVYPVNRRSQKNNVKYMQVEMPYCYIITQCIPYKVNTRMQLATKPVTHKGYFDLLCARTVGFKGSSVDLTYAALPHPFSYSTFPTVVGE